MSSLAAEGIGKEENPGGRFQRDLHPNRAFPLFGFEERCFSFRQAELVGVFGVNLHPTLSPDFQEAGAVGRERAGMEKDGAGQERQRIFGVAPFLGVLRGGKETGFAPREAFGI
jgi:hypothetical protein